MSAGCVRAPLIIPLRLSSGIHHINSIDSTTQIEISTDTPQTQIYFTIDGSRPDSNSWKPRWPQPGPTYLFRELFTLKPGLRTIKAVAVMPDTHQESNVVTKTFDVSEAPGVNKKREVDDHSKPNEYLFHNEVKHVTRTPIKESSYPRKTLANGRKVTASDGHKDKCQDSSIQDESSSKKYKFETQLNSTALSPHKKNQFAMLPGGAESTRNVLPSKFTSHLQHRHKKVDVSNCPVYLAPRSVDADSTFCRSCGKSPPQLPNSISAEKASIMNSNFCSVCGFKMPVNAVKCLVCESTSQSFNKELVAEPDCMDRRLCSICDSLNPLGLKYCLTCEADLPQTPATLVNISRFLHSSQKMPLSHGLSVTSKCFHAADCRICSRENGLDVRFRDWCRIHTPTENYSLDRRVMRECVCASCFCRSPEESKFCSRCGLALVKGEVKNGFGDHPLRQSDITTGTFEKEGCSINSTTLQDNKKTVSTQTVEPFNPNSANSKVGEYGELPSGVRLPIVTPVSPGKGLWRMQMEHVLAHIKAYTRSNPDFQQAIGEPRMGKLLFADINEGQPGEVSICFTFQQQNPSARTPTRDDESGVSVEVSGDTSPLNSFYYFQSHSSNNNAAAETPLAASTPITLISRTFPKNTTRKIVAFRSSSSDSGAREQMSRKNRNKSSKVDNALMRELRPRHKANMRIVRQLLLEGANPSCTDHYGDPLVIRAVRNQHLEVIPALVKAGADVNATGSRNGNTVLHEAVLLGPRSADFVESLLRLGANPRHKNARGLTPRELAVEANALAAVKILTKGIASERADA